MTLTHPTLRSATLTLTLAVALTLGACGGEDEPKPKPTASAVDPDHVSPPDLPVIPEVPDGAGAVADATFGDCAVEEGEQTVEGSVTNPTAEPARYVVAVSWINDTSDVLGRGVADLAEVGEGETVDFSLTAQVPDAATSCTYYVLRAPVG